MTTIQDRIETLKNIFFANGVKCDSEQFLIEDINNLIKEVEEETRNEIIDKIFEHDIGEDGICKNCGKFITYQGYCIQHKYQKLKDKLSITNKEVKK